MKRTQIQLDEETFEQLRRTAYERRTSMAEVIREAVAEYLVDGKKGSAERKLTLADFPWIGMVKAGDTGPVNWSEDHDDILAEDLARELREKAEELRASQQAKP